MNEKIFIIILHWNGKADTLECLESVLNINYPNFEVIVVDNGSVDGSVEAVRRKFPMVTVIENKENLGFAAGSNVGISYALEKGADFILLLNNDAVVDRGILTALIASFNSLPRPGFLGCKIYYYDRPTTIQHFGGRYLEYPILRGVHIGEGEEDDGRFNKVTESEYVTGCAMFAHKSLLEKIGLLDERFFLYWEDGDWCLRAKRAGHKNYVIPTARLWHKVSSCSRSTGAVSSFYSARNRVLFARKHSYKVSLIKWGYRLVKGVLQTRWDQRLTAAIYIVLGHIMAPCGIYGRMPKVLERNILGSAEQRAHSILKDCKDLLRQCFAG